MKIGLFLAAAAAFALQGCVAVKEGPLTGIAIFHVTGIPKNNPESWIYVGQIHKLGEEVDISLTFNPKETGWYYSRKTLNPVVTIDGKTSRSYVETCGRLPEPRKLDGALLFDVPDFGKVQVPSE
jgi:hypothetical protein